MSESWINETLYPDWGQRFRVTRELARVKSDFQDIVVFESEFHGRVLVLDGVIQITERDEFVYQEMLTHVPLLTHPDARRVLIIGAGDGGVLRRVLQHKTVEKAVMVEIDGAVIELSKQHLPDIAGDAWNDPRADVIVGDGIDYVAKAEDGSFDVIIVDSTDPIGVGEVLFTDASTRIAPASSRRRASSSTSAASPSCRPTNCAKPAPVVRLSFRMSRLTSPPCRPMSVAS